MSSLPRLALGALGGTLSMAAREGAEGIVPAVGAQAWAERLPALASLAQVQAHTLCLVPSPSLDFEQVQAALAWARQQVGAGAAGIVLSQGTDNLEETAYLLGLQWAEPVPLVLTGAMRGADDVGADGPANLLDAARVALDVASIGRGALVVMNRQVHQAGDVRKVNALALEAFASPNTGPIGHVIEGRVRYRLPPAPLPEPLVVQRFDQRVALIEATLGEGPELLQGALRAGYAGVVIAGFGAGHVPAGWVSTLALAARHMPVIVASRTGAGTTAFHTYGFAGGEIDLQRHGIHMAGELCPRKCRLLLWALVGAGAGESLPARLAAGTLAA